MRRRSAAGHRPRPRRSTVDGPPAGGQASSRPAGPNDGAARITLRSVLRPVRARPGQYAALRPYRVRSPASPASSRSSPRRGPHAVATAQGPKLTLPATAGPAPCDTGAHLGSAPRDARGHEQSGARYVTVVQSEELPLSTLLVAPTSTSARPATFRPEVDIAGRTTLVLPEQTAAVDPRRLGPSAGHLSFDELRRIKAALRLVLEL